MKRFSTFGLVALAAAGLALGAQAAAPSKTVRTASGAVRGEIVDGVASFKGVPFAAAPVGPRRWRAPEPVKPWAGVREAQDFGAPCAQAAFDWNRAVAGQSREDCLYLNVWAPVAHKGKALPVMVFFPGGAYHGGSARGLSGIEPSYDGSKLARRGVVVVTANYRLGMFGFLAHPELTAESPRHASGDYALMDQIAALKWVQANIGRFGGDVGNVTASGQSAGSYSIGVLMTSPLARGLFQKAIMLSGTVVEVKAGQPDLKAAEAEGAAFLQGLGAPADGAIAALRRRPAQDLLTAMLADPGLRAAEPRKPVVEGYVLPEQPALVFQAGREAAVPLMVGNTARDGDMDSMGVTGTPKAVAAAADAARPLAATHRVVPLSAEEVKAVQDYYGPYGELADQAVRLYGDPAATDPAHGDVAVAFSTDIVFRCGASLTAQWHARANPTWRYEFSHGYEPQGAVHLWDLAYLFGWQQPPADQPRDARLEDQMQRYWVSFARSGNPNAAGLPAWPKSGARQAYLDFASEGAVARTGPRAAACDLFARKTERDLRALRGGPTAR